MGNPSPVQLQTAVGIRNTEAQTENIEADTDNKRAENPNIKAQNQVITNTAALLIRQATQTEAYTELTDAQQDQVRQAIQNLQAELINLKLKGLQISEETLLTHARRFLTKEETGNARVDKILKLLDVPEAVNKAMGELKYEDIKQNISPLLNDLGKVTNSATGASNALSRRRLNKYIIKGN